MEVQEVSKSLLPVPQRVGAGAVPLHVNYWNRAIHESLGLKFSRVIQQLIHKWLRQKFTQLTADGHFNISTIILDYLPIYSSNMCSLQVMQESELVKSVGWDFLQHEIRTSANVEVTSIRDVRYYRLREPEFYPMLHVKEFHPGVIGLVANWNEGMIANVLYGDQGHSTGVQKGWKIVGVENEPYAESKLDACIEGTRPYKVTFLSFYNIMTYPLEAFCRQGVLEELKSYFARGDVNIPIGGQKQTPLFIVCQYGHRKCAQFLLSRGADLNQQGMKGMTPTYIACQNAQSEVVELLVSYKADVNKQDEFGETPLMVASENGHTKCLDILINSKHSDVNMKENEGQNALWVATRGGHLECISRLIQAGADVNTGDNDNTTPLSIACHSGHVKCAQLLIEHGALVNMEDTNGWTPALLASFRGHVECLELILAEGACLDQSDRDNASPLYVAAQEGHLECVELLIKYKADINHSMNDGATPTYIATQNAHIDCLHVLINAGADIHRPLIQGFTPLYSACHAGHLEVLKLLTLHGASLECTGGFGTPCHITSAYKRIDCMKFLVYQDAPIDGVNEEHEAMVQQWRLEIQTQEAWIRAFFQESAIHERTYGGWIAQNPTFDTSMTTFQPFFKKKTFISWARKKKMASF